jgi:putative transposase
MVMKGYIPLERNSIMTIPHKLLDEFLKNYQEPEDLLGKDGIMAQLKKRLIERAMAAEMTDHL